MSGQAGDELTISPKCHPRAPLRASLRHGGELVLSCWQCGADVLQPGTLPLAKPDRTLARIIAAVALGVFCAVIVLAGALSRA